MEIQTGIFHQIEVRHPLFLTLNRSENVAHIALEKGESRGHYCPRSKQLLH